MKSLLQDTLDLNFFRHHSLKMVVASAFGHMGVLMTSVDHS